MTEATKRSQDPLHIKDIAASHAAKIVEAGRQAGRTPEEIWELCQLMIKDIAASHATKIVEAGRQAGLTPTQICELCELVTSIVVYIEAEREAAGDKVAWAQSLLNFMTKRMHRRVAALLRGDTTDEWWR